MRGSHFLPTVNGANAISSGVDKGSSGSVFRQGLNAQPACWGQIGPNDRAGDVKDISALVPKVLLLRRQAESIATGSECPAFYSTLLGPAPAAPIRIVAARRGSGFRNGPFLSESELFAA